MGRNEFISVLRELSEERNLTLATGCGDWILTLNEEVNGKSFFMYGYNLDLNGSAASLICGDKNATSIVLSRLNIRHVHHEAFLNPGDAFICQYIPASGSIHSLVEYCNSIGPDVVLKPLKGTGGRCVFRCHSARDVESAALQIFRMDYGISACKYYEIRNEFRLIFLNSKIKLIFSKIRNFITGDGQKNISQLLATASPVSGPLPSIPDPNYVPPAGEKYYPEWKHNLGTGAEVCLDIDPAMAARLEELGLAAVEAIGLKFCSVDIIEEGGTGELLILEINSGVMFDKFMTISQTHRDIVKSIYGEALDALIKQNS